MLRIEQRVRRLTVNALDRASNAVNLLSKGEGPRSLSTLTRISKVR